MAKPLKIDPRQRAMRVLLSDELELLQK